MQIHFIVIVPRFYPVFVVWQCLHIYLFVVFYLLVHSGAYT